MKENYSDFIKKAYQMGRVKDSSETFKDYPPEEEWHHGDEDFLLGILEKNSVMMYDELDCE